MLPERTVKTCKPISLAPTKSNARITTTATRTVVTRFQILLTFLFINPLFTPVFSISSVLNLEGQKKRQHHLIAAFHYSDGCISSFTCIDASLSAVHNSYYVRGQRLIIRIMSQSHIPA